MTASAAIRSAFLFFSFFPVSLFAGPPLPSTGSIEVIVEGLLDESGALRVSLYNSQHGFPHNPKKAFRRRVLSLKNEKGPILFEEIPYGYYAVSVLHDRNENGRLDKNFFRIPKEPFGASNNPPLRRGPPKLPRGRV